MEARQKFISCLNIKNVADQSDHEESRKQYLLQFLEKSKRVQFSRATLESHRLQGRQGCPHLAGVNGLVSVTTFLPRDAKQQTHFIGNILLSKTACSLLNSCSQQSPTAPSAS